MYSVFQPSELKEFSAPYLEKSDSSLFSQFGLKSLQLSLETQQPGVIPIAETKKIIITPAQAPPSPRKLNKEVQAKLAKGGGQDQVVVETGRVVEKNGVDTPALIPSLNVSAAAKKEEVNICLSWGLLSGCRLGTREAKLPHRPFSWLSQHTDAKVTSHVLL